MYMLGSASLSIGKSAFGFRHNIRRFWLGQICCMSFWDTTSFWSPFLLFAYVF